MPIHGSKKELEGDWDWKVACKTISPDLLTLITTKDQGTLGPARVCSTYLHFLEAVVWTIEEL